MGLLSSYKSTISSGVKAALLNSLVVLGYYSDAYTYIPCHHRLQRQLFLPRLSETSGLANANECAALAQW